MTAATVAAATDASPPIRMPTREPWPARLVALSLASGLAVLTGTQAESIVEIFSSEWPQVVFWLALLFAIALFPVSVGDTQFVVDIAPLIAIALLYPPEVAGVLAAIGLFDSREFRGRIGISRAIFNRAQNGFTTLVAGHVFQLVSPGFHPWPRALFGTALAVASYYLVNLLLVSLHVAARSRIATRVAAARLRVASTGMFLLTYMGYGILGLVIARLFLDVGAWSVVMFLVPMIVASKMLARSQELQVLATRLQEREHLLERLLDSSDDERKDERLRIAGELHDDVQQELVHLVMLGRLAEREAQSKGVALADLRDLVRRCEESIQSLRAVIHDLRKSPLGRGGLIPTLRGLVQQLQLDWQVGICLQSPEELELRSEIQVVVYQVAREAMLNALKHSGAGRVDVAIGFEGDLIVLTVSDNGAGFDPGSVDSSKHSGLGLMIERARRLGGQVSLKATPNEGTWVVATFPDSPRGEQPPD